MADYSSSYNEQKTENQIITCSGMIINGNYNIVNGSRCLVTGNNNTINGSRCVVNGNDNYVNGSRCAVCGINNQVSGSRCTVKGIINRVVGSGCQILGYNNQVYGSGCTIKEEDTLSAQNIALLQDYSLGIGRHSHDEVDGVAVEREQDSLPQSSNDITTNKEEIVAQNTVCKNLVPFEIDPAYSECSICFDKCIKKSGLMNLMDCGHTTICTNCIEKMLPSVGFLTCPLCQAQVKKISGKKIYV